MALDEPEADEQSIEINGIDVLIAEGLDTIVSGAKIDYIIEPEGEGFVLTGPNDSC
jgi:Fe-S cluster assembly iron-binding protein IscA